MKGRERAPNPQPNLHSAVWVGQIRSSQPGTLQTGTLRICEKVPGRSPLRERKGGKRLDPSGKKRQPSNLSKNVVSLANWLKVPVYKVLVCEPPIKRWSSPASGYSFGCVCSYMAGITQVCDATNLGVFGLCHFALLQRGCAMGAGLEKACFRLLSLWPDFQPQTPPPHDQTHRPTTLGGAISSRFWPFLTKIARKRPKTTKKRPKIGPRLTLTMGLGRG